MEVMKKVVSAEADMAFSKLQKIMNATKEEELLFFRDRISTYVTNYYATLT